MSSQSTAVRFRHSAGDLGPLIFSPSANIQTVKERLLAEWPRGVHGLLPPRLDIMSLPTIASYSLLSVCAQMAPWGQTRPLA